MGSEIEGEENEKPQHSVTVPSFFMSQYQVTQAQWKAVFGLEKIERNLIADPSRFKGNNRPVEAVSWEDATEFCKRLSQQTGRSYRLPTEAEWEYACRAGTTTPFCFGETIAPKLANYDATQAYGSGPKGKPQNQTTDVGDFPANSFGLYDMHGNVWEWCLDGWAENYYDTPTDGSAWESEGSFIKLLRGGSWNDAPDHCRSAYRRQERKTTKDLNIGFRVVCDSSWNV